MNFRGKSLVRTNDIVQDGHFKEFGKWYLPNNENVSVGGIIIYENGWITLETMYSLDDAQSKNIIEHINARSDRLKKYDTVFGVLSTDESVILKNCTEVGRINNKFRYNVNLLYVSNSVQGCTTDFDNLMIEYDNLFEWRIPPQIKVDHKENHDWVITYKQAKPINVEINNNNSLSIYQTYSISHSSVQKNYNIPQGMILSIKTKSGKKFEDVKKRAEIFRRFLMLCIDEVTYPISIHVGINKILTNVLESHVEYENKPYVDILEISPNYLQLEKDFENIIKKWYDLHDEIEETMSNFFAALLFKKSQTIGIHFLQIVYSIEALQREKFSQAIPKIKGESITKKRLEIVLSPFKEHFEKIDIDKVVNTRDYLSHGFIEGKKDTIMPENYEMLYTTQRLTALIQFHFFNNIITDKQLLNEIMMKRLKKIDHVEELNQKNN